MRLLFMQSNGGLTDARALPGQGRDPLRARPAASSAWRAPPQPAGFDRVIGFDMGGTSTDVSHYAGEFERAFETQVAGVRMRAPMMSIHTVAAGGGSILHFDGAASASGPDSAGADPGPGLLPARRPADGHRRQRDARQDPAGVLPAGVRARAATQPLDADVVRAQFAALAAEIARATGDAPHARGGRRGLPATSRSANMANAIKQISVQRGHDVTATRCTASAAPAASTPALVADALGMTRVFIHPLAGVLSAYGMGLADQTAMREQAVEAPLTPTALAAAARARSTRSARRAARELRDAGRRRRSGSRVHRRVHLRYDGTDTALVVPFGTRRRRCAPRSRPRTAQRFAFLMPDQRARRRGGVGRGDRRAGDAPTEAARRAGRARAAAPRPRRVRDVHRRRVARRARSYRARATARPATSIDGPGDHRRGERDHRRRAGLAGARSPALDHLVLRARRSRARSARAIGTDGRPGDARGLQQPVHGASPSRWALRLQNTAYSVNIKERLDFSCALFDADGNLIANAPHMPVHLGSMGESHQDGDRARTPAGCGRATSTCSTTRTTAARTCPTSPWSRRCSTTRATDVLFYVASRGHHADIGGITPGLDAAVQPTRSRRKAC